MQIVIDISEKEYQTYINHIEAILDSSIPLVHQDLLRAVINGTPLPKGHGRLIDADSIYQIVRPIEPSDANWGMTAETAKQIIHDVFDNAPTIIEADGGDVE